MQQTPDTPEEIAKVARSYTGQYLKPLLKGVAPGRIERASKKMKAAE
ncbi:MAG: hypothetical protein KGJ78_15060 [Alphaproteobacteria bacterium]|nr:hypothetical protein [Alphaproteobacteria bacterium]